MSPYLIQKIRNNLSDKETPPYILELLDDAEMLNIFNWASKFGFSKSAETSCKVCPIFVQCTIMESLPCKTKNIFENKDLWKKAYKSYIESISVSKDLTIYI